MSELFEFCWFMFLKGTLKNDEVNILMQESSNCLTERKNQREH